MPNQTVSNDAGADDDALGLGRKFAHVLPLIENSLVMYTRYISDKRLSITGTGSNTTVTVRTAPVEVRSSFIQSDPTGSSGYAAIR